MPTGPSPTEQMFPNDKVIQYNSYYNYYSPARPTVSTPKPRCISGKILSLY